MSKGMKYELQKNLDTLFNIHIFHVLFWENDNVLSIITLINSDSTILEKCVQNFRGRFSLEEVQRSILHNAYLNISIII